MQTTDPQHQLDLLLDDANPLTRNDAAAFDAFSGFDELLEHVVADDVADIDRPKRRRRPTRRAITGMALTATIVAGGASAAVAGWTPVHTGVFGHAGDTENDTTEFLNLAADDMPQVAARLGANIPFPPGDDVRAYIPGLIRGGGMMQATGVQSYLGTDAVCAWWGYWLQSDRTGDQPARDRATSVLAAVPTWPALVQSDGGGVISLYKEVATAARNGDAAVIRNVYAANSCAALPQKWTNR